jgi:tRNA G37 N-methylase Trm5
MILFALGSSGCGRADEADKGLPPRPRVPGQPDVRFLPTPNPIVDRMLELAEVRADDVVYDLGCGDGRIVITAAKKYGCKAVGIEIDAKLVDQAKQNVKRNGLEHRVAIRQGDIFEEDFSDATVVTLYLLPDLNMKLMPKLQRLKEGTRIVSHSFGMKGARPDRVVRVLGKKVYFWRVPWKRE